MKSYATSFLVAGVVIPIVLHIVAADRMPWWPDTVTMGIGFGACAIAVVWKNRKDREMNQRIWSALKALVRSRNRSRSG